MEVEAILMLSTEFKMLLRVGMLEFGHSQPHPRSRSASVSTFPKLLYIAAERPNAMKSTCTSRRDCNLAEESFVCLGLFLISNLIQV